VPNLLATDAEVKVDEDILLRVEDVINSIILPKASEDPEVIESICLGAQALSRNQTAYPMINRMTGRVEYDLMGTVINAERALAAFDILESLGLVKKAPAGAVLQCPKCGSARLRAYLTCRFCGSPLVVKTRLIQHVVCGYTGEEEEFVKGKRLICPKCGLELKHEGSDYIVIAEIFKCLNCGARQRSPEVQLECLECGHHFKPLEGRYVLLYRFEPTETGFRLWRSGIWELAFFKLVAEQLGFRVRVNARLPIPGAEGYSFNLEISIRRGLRRAYRIYIDSESFLYETFKERAVPIARLKAAVMREGRELYILVAMPEWERRYEGSEFIDYREVLKGDVSVLLGTKAVIFPSLESDLCPRYYENVRVLLNSIVTNVFGISLGGRGSEAESQKLTR
jgi:DNA-directed RNA polymerase subunit RPC12/RpoP